MSRNHPSNANMNYPPPRWGRPLRRLRFRGCPLNLRMAGSCAGPSCRTPLQRKERFNCSRPRPLSVCAGRSKPRTARRYCKSTVTAAPLEVSRFCHLRAAPAALRASGCALRCPVMSLSGAALCKSSSARRSARVFPLCARPAAYRARAAAAGHSVALSLRPSHRSLFGASHATLRLSCVCAGSSRLSALPPAAGRYIRLQRPPMPRAHPIPHAHAQSPRPRRTTCIGTPMAA